MNYAVIQTGGKQYKVFEGQTVEVERLPQNAAETVVFTDVLLAVTDTDVQIGTPTIAGMSVTAEVVAAMRGPKIRVAKFKAKSRYRRTTGHRQALSQIKILSIGAQKAQKKEVKAETEVVKPEARTVKKKKA